MSRKDHGEYEALLMKAVDGFLRGEERKEFEEHLLGCEDCREELRDFEEMKLSTDRVRQRIMLDAKIEPFVESLGRRAVQWVGWGVMLLGVMLLMGVGSVTFFVDEKVPMWVRVGVGLTGGGALLLFGYVFQLRLRGHRDDPYKEIDL